LGEKNQTGIAGLTRQISARTALYPGQVSSPVRPNILDLKYCLLGTGVEMKMTSLYKSPQGEKIVMDMYAELLERWPVPRDELRLQTRIGETFIIASGPLSGAPIILLHGANSNALSWMGDIPTLAKLHRVYAVDIPGDPGRSAPSRPSWNGNGYLEWLQDILIGLKIEKTALIGLSQGGWNALKFASNHPEKISKLVLLSPAGLINDRPSFLFKAILYSLAGKKGVLALSRLTFGDIEMPEDAVKYMDVILTHFKSRFETLQKFSDSELSRLRMPVLLIGGRQDAIRDIDRINERLTKSVQNLKSLIYQDQGHVLINQADSILSFLDGA
jgi:pimeloyl-ACP methyl ester carboxylesterase